MFVKKQISNLLCVLILLTWALPLFAIQFVFQRTQFMAIGALFTLSFVAYVALIRNVFSGFISFFNLKSLFIIAVLSRLILVFSMPNLSDDFYRFYWDGHLFLNHINPFENTPAQVIEQIELSKIGLTKSDFQHLNSPNYQTVYPLFSQILFATCVRMSGGSIWLFVCLLKLVLLGFEMFSMYLMYQFSKKSPPPSIKPKNKHFMLVLYAFNPLLLIEVVGNMHLEGIMLTALLCFIYAIFIVKNNFLAITALCIAVGFKVIPLLFLPILLPIFGIKKSISYSSIVLLFTTLIFLPFIDFNNTGGFGLYFGRFEFNASLYYIIRAIGYYFYGEHPSWSVTPILSLFAAVFIVLLSVYYFIKKRLYTYTHVAQAMLFAYCLFLLASATVHPWYVLPAFGLSCLTHYRFALVWSYFVFVSYWIYEFKTESLPLIAIEYVVVILIFMYEIRAKTRLEFRTQNHD